MAALPLLLLLLHLLPVSGKQSKDHNHNSSFSISDQPWNSSQINRTLLSPNSLFSAGFLPHHSNKSLSNLAIWVEASVNKTPVWSLGPVPSSSVLYISASGDLTLVNHSGHNLFPSAASGAPKSTFLQLNNNGSLTFGSWTSFSSPVDTLLPNQLLRNGTFLSSGQYRFDGTSLWFYSQNYFKTDPPISSFNSDGELTSTAVASDYRQNDTLRRLTIDADGNLRLYSLPPKSGGHWKIVWVALFEVCKIPNKCGGANSICFPEKSYDNHTCKCAPGFRNSTAGKGCLRKKDYLPDSKFLPLDQVSFTAKQGTVDLSPADLDQCRSTCRKNSSCAGFSYILNGLRTCYHHYGELVDGFWSMTTPSTMFIRVAISETDASSLTSLTSIINVSCPLSISLPLPEKQMSPWKDGAIIVTLLSLELLLGALIFLAFHRRFSKYRDMARALGLEFLPAGGPKRFSYSELRAATADFSNILGSGGYGVVYHGNLPDGRTVAVKQLRKSSGGDAEFWAEVATVARMHHLNLVRIWGFCTEKEHRLLVYEYIPNGSLDKFLFQDIPTEFAGTDEDSRSNPRIAGNPRRVLDLNIRYRIALGVARAIAYLHEECLEWVLHCDIKPENILLDDNFCPKVSDFGMAKLTSKKERVSMSRLRGTRGYMAPEWAMNEEPITAKADVYSFGVVLLELVAGMRCSDFRRESVDSVDWCFPRWAYDKVFVEKKVEDILDARILGSFDDPEKAEMVERMVKTAMWCLQDRAEARPSMGKAAKMLEGSLKLAEPAKPAIFYLEGKGGGNFLCRSLEFEIGSLDNWLGR